MRLKKNNQSFPLLQRVCIVEKVSNFIKNIIYIVILNALIINVVAAFKQQWAILTTMHTLP